MNIKLQLCKLRLVTILWITDWFPSIKEKICLEREHFSEKKANNKISSTKMKWEFLCRIFFSPFQFFLSLYIFFEITIQERKNFCLLLVYHFSRTKKNIITILKRFFLYFLFENKSRVSVCLFFFWFYIIFTFFSAFSPFGSYYRWWWWSEYWKGRSYNFFFSFWSFKVIVGFKIQ